MKMLLVISLMNSCFLMTVSHPILIMTLILTQTTLLCLISWVFLKMSWFAFILFLIFLGGLMVLFIYITSLASNEMMKIEIKNFIPSSIFFAMVMMSSLYLLNSQSMEHSIFESQTKTFFNMYSHSTMILIMSTMVYLLLTLIVVVKISDKFKAPIKTLT